MEAYIIRVNRTAVAKSKRGGFSHMRSDDLAVQLLQKMIKDIKNFGPKLVDDVIVGCANPEGEQGFQIGRQISVRALGQDVAGVTVNRYCASGLETISMAVAKIKAGMGHCYIAGGTESMTMIPMTGYKLAPSFAVASSTPQYLTGMGTTAEAVSKKFNIGRQAADEFSYNSHVKAANAIDKGFFKEDIIPIDVQQVTVENDKKITKDFVVSEDEGVRRETTVEGLGKLRPVFASNGVVTAGNSSQTSDGAAFAIIMSERMVKQLNLELIARLVSCSVAGVDSLLMGIGPVSAIPKALGQAGLKLKDIDQIELNEAFAVQALAVIQEAKLNPEVVNPNGGAIALGHPLGCTGAKLTTQIINDMRRKKQKYGIVTACVGGGQGIAGVIELLH